jgi:hypothetical protein
VARRVLVARTPKTPRAAKTTDSKSEVLGSTAAEERTTVESGPSPPTPEAQTEGPVARSAAFDAGVADIRRRMASDIVFLFPRLEDQVRRRLGVAPLSARAAVLAGLVGVGSRLMLALLASALVGDWAGIPWGRWTVIIVLYGLYDATQPLRTPPLDVPWGPRVRRWAEDWTALLPTIARESDLRNLAAFVRRWHRMPVAVGAGVAVAVIMLGSCGLFTPTALGELPAGSIVLLALLLYDFGAVVVNPLDSVVMAREARYDHHLFLSSPVDSPEVQKAVRMTNFFGFATGMWITIYLVLAVFLVSWESPLVLPLAVGFVVFGYLTAIGSTLGWRASIEKIVRRARDKRLAVLRRRVSAFEPRFEELSPEESDQLRGLIELHNMIRDAPTAPTTTRTLLRAAVGLMIPTIMFVIAVFGEVYAERILDAILP